MKRYFITGLVILLPLAVTVAIVFFVINFLTNPFVGFIEHFLEPFSWFIRFRGIIHFLLQIILLLLLFFFTVLLGFLTRMLVFKSFLGMYDYVMHRIPLIKTIYKATKQVIQTILGNSSKSFKQVVMVPFPNKGSWAIGLISSAAPAICEKTLNIPLLSVFVPTTPNPTSGFLMVYRQEEVIYIDMKIEDALKYIISCGVISNGDASPDIVDKVKTTF